MNVDTDNLAYIGDLDYESKVHILATVILLEEGGPLAEQLLAMRPLDEDAPAAAIAEDLRRRRAFLRTTLAWPAAERKLCAIATATTTSPSRSASTAVHSD